jgi:glycerol-3-phosphate acyltransferase PlsY
MALSPVATLFAFSVGLIVFLLSRYPNLGYVIGSAILPFVFAIHPIYSAEIRLPLVIFGLVLAGIMAYSHAGNMRDILRGVEQRAELHGFA